MTRRRHPARAANASLPPSSRRGSALIIALWVLLALALLVSGFAFDMAVEAGVTGHYRNRLKAQYLAQAGVEQARSVIMRSLDVKSDAPEEDEDEDAWVRALNLSRGVAVSGMTIELGAGRFTLDIIPEQGRRNVHMLADEDWEEILDQANIPQERWGALIDCFNDWVDEGDEHRLLGAESDDSFYEDRGYECKNAALDTIDELLLIKGFSQAVVFGGVSEEDDGETLEGIARWLTTWGDGKVNLNTASREVLLTVSGLNEQDVEALLEGRKGPDGVEGTKDDGFDSVEKAMSYIGLTNPAAAERLTTKGESILRVVSIGEVEGVRNGIWCILRAADKKVTPLFWREEPLE
ncbi:MAG TPA: type II secretion system protein GspK [Kiritimatiellia bacterium]|nr:type II secretion system protein GspK [Kiritimatiellia bacterium]HSA18871.1 type II secretion system protein GspK [Kiritimatiellia bacterium]